MASTDDWSADANDALEISLDMPTKNGPKQFNEPFSPTFTYAMFGDAQQIFGYKGLSIDLRFRANDMRPFVKTTYEKKMDAVGDTEADDVDGILKEFLPKVAFSTEADYIEGTKKLAKQSPKWTPPGELLTTIQEGDSTYEIWKGSMADGAVKQMVKRLQILSLLFIDGGSLIIDEENERPNHPSDSRWTIFFLFRKDKSPDDPDTQAYTFVGYSTVFRFFYMNREAAKAAPPTELGELPKQGEFDLSELPCRSRISQFVILPPFQRLGNGARLYNAIFDYYKHHAPTRVLTVEAPNEEFDELRDVCDLAHLRTIPAFNDLQIKKDYKIPDKGFLKMDFLDLDAIRKLCTESKISERQFMRCVEMHLMSKLPASVWSLIRERNELPNPKLTAKDRDLYNLWRMWVKMRIYVQNRDLLGQLERDERAQKLSETVNTVEDGYVTILDICDRRRSKTGVRGESGKRKLDETEDCEAAASKKARVEEEDGSDV